MSTPPVADGKDFETIIAGAGYTGLSTALHLAERGHKVALLEAKEPGWGAAGRNGGQVNAGFKKEPDAVLQEFGGNFGPRLLRVGLDGPRKLFALVDRLRIHCDAVQCGTLRTARSPTAVRAVRAAAEQWNRHGASVEVWDADRVARETGSRRYNGGFFDPRGGAVNPLALARGLAVAAQRAGASIHAQTPVLGIFRDKDRWRVQTPSATLHSDQVVLTTQAYSGHLWPDVSKTFVPAFSSIVATEPLSDELAGVVLPGRQVVYESGHITAYFRRDSQNRLLMGGRGVQRPANSLADYQHLIGYAERLWPALRTVRWTHWWNGQLALTPDFYPRFYVPAPGLCILIGFARGIASGVSFGEELATLVAGGSRDAFPLPTSPIRPIPMHRYWRLGVAARILQGRMLDLLGY
jgi:glycine/D-amino acid oxidase-like deaminating enzyme